MELQFKTLKNVKLFLSRLLRKIRNNFRLIFLEIMALVLEKGTFGAGTKSF